MKLKRIKCLRPAALAAVGVFLGRAAQADTLIDFDAFPSGLGQNSAVPQTFGDNAMFSTEGVTVTGFGTPNIGLSWEAVQGNGFTRWEFYIDSVWSAAQLNQSTLGSAND